MKYLIAILLACSTIIGQAQSTGDVRTSYWNSSTWVSFTLSGTGVFGMSGTTPFVMTSGTGANQFASGADQRFVETTLSAAGITSPVVAEDLTWSPVSYGIIKLPMEPGFELLRNNFSQRGDTSFWDAEQIIDQTYQIAVGDSVKRIYSPVTLKIPYFAVQVDVAQMSGNASGDQVFCGVRDDVANTTLGGVYNNVTGETFFYFNIAGGGDLILGTKSLAIPGAFRMAFVVTDKSASIWVSQSPAGGWAVVNSIAVDSYYDFRVPANLAAVHPYWYGYNPAGSGDPIIITEVSTGYSGGVGIANQSPINYEDGTPIIKDGEAFFVASVAGHPANSASNYSIPVSHAAIYAINLNTYAVRCVSKINTLRSGVLYGENSGQVLFDRGINKWRLLIPTWGSVTADLANAVVVVNSYTLDADLLSGGVFVLESPSTLSLPSVLDGQYDPHAVKIDGVWRMVFDESVLTAATYIPVLASSTDFATWTLITRRPGFYAEGGKIMKIGGDWVVLIGSLAGGGTTYILSATDLSDIGTWTDDQPPDPWGVPPHPCLFYRLQGGVTEFFQFKFDGILEPNYNATAEMPYTEGQWFIYKANETQGGYEWPRVKTPWIN